MSTKYLLKNLYQTSDSIEHQIDSSRFNNLKKANSVLSNAYRIEEIYEIIIKCYLELEQEALKIATTNMLRTHPGYLEFSEASLILNIRLLGLLSSIRLYQDQLIPHVKRCLPGNGDVSRIIKEFYSCEYDGSLEYRFMYALRNYIQHNSLAVHHTAMPSWKEKDNNIEYINFSLSFYSLKETLGIDNEIKGEILDELPDKVDLWFASKKYVECISRIHNQVRELLYNEVNVSRLEFETALEDFQKLSEGLVQGVRAYVISNPEQIEHLDIFLEWDDIRKQLLYKNRTPLNLADRYVSSYTKNRVPNP